MYRVLRREARRRRRALVESTTARLRAGEDVDVGELHERLDALAGVGNLRTPTERALASATPLLIAVALLAPLWWLREEAPVIELNATASRVVVSLGSDQALDLGHLGPVFDLHAAGLDATSSDIGSIDFRGALGRGVVITPGPVYLGRAELTPTDPPAADAAVAVSRRDELAQLVLRGFRTAIRADLESPGKVTTSAPGTTREAVSGAMMVLDGPNEPSATVRLSFRPGERSIDLPVMRPTSLDLRDVAFDARGEVERFSSIDRAELVFMDSGRTHSFLRGASLRLGDLNGDVRLTLAPGGVALSYQGSAGIVARGVAADQTLADLRPSLAEWISSDRTVALLWSSLIFVAGLVLTVRRSVSA